MARQTISTRLFSGKEQDKGAGGEKGASYYCTQFTNGTIDKEWLAVVLNLFSKVASEDSYTKTVPRTEIAVEFVCTCVSEAL